MPSHSSLDLARTYRDLLCSYQLIHVIFCGAGLRRHRLGSSISLLVSCFEIMITWTSQLCVAHILSHLEYMIVCARLFLRINITPPITSPRPMYMMSSVLLYHLFYKIVCSFPRIFCTSLPAWIGMYRCDMVPGIGWYLRSYRSGIKGKNMTMRCSKILWYTLRVWANTWIRRKYCCCTCEQSQSDSVLCITRYHVRERLGFERHQQVEGEVRSRLGWYVCNGMAWKSLNDMRSLSTCHTSCVFIRKLLLS